MAPHEVIVGGVGVTPTLEHVLVVVQGATVVLDSVASQSVKKQSPPPKAFQAAEPPAAASDGAEPCLDGRQTRAALFYKLLSLINGKSGVRLAVVEALAALLNAGVTPRLPAAASDAPTLAALASFLQGVGVGAAADAAAVSQQQQQLSAAEALAAAGIAAPPGLSAAERALLQDGQSASAGTAALCVQAGRLLLAAANATTALSAEALQADVKALDADAVEAQPHKGALEAAEEMRGLLDGSRQVGARKGGGAGSLPAVNAAAQVHSALADALSAAAAPAKAELAMTALPPGKDFEQLQQAASPALANSLLLLATALLKAAGLSLRRGAVVVQRLPLVVAAAAGESLPDATAAQAALLQSLSAATTVADACKQQVAGTASQLALADAEEAAPALAAAQAAYASLQALQQALAAEALAAVVSLRLQDGTAPASEAPAAAAAASAAAAPATAEGNSSDRKEGGGKKDKKDKGKAAAAQGMVLGKGTVVLRGCLEMAAAAGPAGGGVAAVAAADGSGLVDQLAARLALADLVGDGGSGQQEHEQRLAGVAEALDPLGPHLPQLLVALRAVVEANMAKRKPKIAKGARDFMPDQMAIREVAFGTITSVFKRHGAVSIDTPVFELRETLMGKYGEDSKLIYDLADQGGEILSLRYDLTVPFARYVALHGAGNIKRYHIARVYRRDQPQMARGRFREFFQCDFDIAGAYPAMVPDAEVLKVLVEILDDLALGRYEVKLNHRRLLDAMLDIAGVPPHKFRPICSAIDKLDKEPWEAVRAEMVDEKGLPPAVADRIGEFVVLRGEPMALLDKLSAEAHPLSQHPDSAAALAELRLLFGFLDAMGALQPIVFDLSLARGLDYYTGVIYEAVLQGANVGSIAAGGRYDTLVGMFSSQQVPAVGVSIGVERVFAIMEAQMRDAAAAAGGVIRETETEVLVASIGGGMQPTRMRLAAALWAGGVKAEFGYKAAPKMADQLGYALKAGIPFMVLFGDSELAAGVVKIKDLDANAEETVPEGEMVARLQALVATKANRRVVYLPQQEQQQQQGAAA